MPQQQSNDINTAQISHNNQEQIPPPTKKRYGNFHSIIWTSILLAVIILNFKLSDGIMRNLHYQKLRQMKEN